MPHDGDTHPVDAITADLLEVYSSGQRRLETLVETALRRGLDPARLGTEAQLPGDATAAYRAAQLAQVKAIVAEIKATGRRTGATAVAASYRRTLDAVDVVLGEHSIGPTFGRVHAAQVDVLAANLTASLEAAAATVGENAAAVFARVSAVERGATPRQFVGRRVDDPYRRLTLEEVGQGVVAGDTRRAVSASLARRLVSEGVSDAVTGFVDAAGRRWSLESYANMAVRTTTREASTRATVNRLVESGQDLITISEHAHPADICSEFEGNTYSLTGATPGYDVAPDLPPFHPSCVHVAYPAGASLDAFEAALLG